MSSFTSFGDSVDEVFARVVGLQETLRSRPNELTVGSNDLIAMAKQSRDAGLWSQSTATAFGSLLSALKRYERHAAGAGRTLFQCQDETPPLDKVPSPKAVARSSPRGYRSGGAGAGAAPTPGPAPAPAPAPDRPFRDGDRVEINVAGAWRPGVYRTSHTGVSAPVVKLDMGGVVSTSARLAKSGKMRFCHPSAVLSNDAAATAAAVPSAPPSPYVSAGSSEDAGRQGRALFDHAMLRDCMKVHRSSTSAATSPTRTVLPPLGPTPSAHAMSEPGVVIHQPSERISSLLAALRTRSEASPSRRPRSTRQEGAFKAGDRVEYRVGGMWRSGTWRPGAVDLDIGGTATCSSTFPDSRVRRIRK